MWFATSSDGLKPDGLQAQDVNLRLDSHFFLFNSSSDSMVNKGIWLAFTTIASSELVSSETALSETASSELASSETA
jgi:hypothetical protein